MNAQDHAGPQVVSLSLAVVVLLGGCDRATRLSPPSPATTKLASATVPESSRLEMLRDLRTETQADIIRDRARLDALAKMQDEGPVKEGVAQARLDDSIARTSKLLQSDMDFEEDLKKLIEKASQR